MRTCRGLVPVVHVAIHATELVTLQSAEDLRSRESTSNRTLHKACWGDCSAPEPHRQLCTPPSIVPTAPRQTASPPALRRQPTRRGREGWGAGLRAPVAELTRLCEDQPRFRQALLASSEGNHAAAQTLCLKKTNVRSTRRVPYEFAKTHHLPMVSADRSRLEAVAVAGDAIASHRRRRTCLRARLALVSLCQTPAD